MYVHTQRSVFRPYLVVNALSLFSELLSKCSMTLVYLVTPEDTTENGVERHLLIRKYNGSNINGAHKTKGAIKAVFWIGISLAIALLMGQLS